MTASSGSGGISYSINAEGAMRKFIEAEAKIKTKVVSELNRIGQLGASKIKSAAPRDTSYMANHIHATLATEVLPVVTIIGDASYTTDVDKGTAPHFPPPEALEGWAKTPRFPTAAADSWSQGRSHKGGTEAKNFIEPVVDEMKVDAKMAMLESVKGISL